MRRKHLTPHHWKAKQLYLKLCMRKRRQPRRKRDGGIWIGTKIGAGVGPTPKKGPEKHLTPHQMLSYNTWQIDFFYTAAIVNFSDVIMGLKALQFSLVRFLS